MPAFGPTFWEELTAAGVSGAAASYNMEAGTVEFAASVDQATRDIILAVIAAHVPEMGDAEEMAAAAMVDGSPIMRALIAWLAGALTLDPATVRTELIAIVKADAAG